MRVGDSSPNPPPVSPRRELISGADQTTKSVQGHFFPTNRAEEACEKGLKVSNVGLGHRSKEMHSIFSGMHNSFQVQGRYLKG